MRCTIKDIAKDTTLSLATISKYLNGKTILPENQKLIEASIQKLGYVPNRSAQMLRGKKTNTITILLPVISDYFWGTLCSFIEEYLQTQGYSTIIHSYDPALSDQSEVYHQLLSSQSAGAIIVPRNLGQINLARLLSEGGIPIVYLDQVVESPPADAITSDNRAGARAATCYLLERGHRNLCLIGGDLESYTNKERVKGFLDACKEYRLPFPMRHVLGGDFSSESAVHSFHEMMALQKRPTAVLFLGYFLTVAAIQEITEAGLRIPQDLSIISFDDDEMFPAFEPPITVVSQNMPKLGQQAGKMLMKRISGNNTGFPEIQIIKTHLIERGSVWDFRSSKQME